MDRQFKKTIAHAILKQSKVISDATGIPSNDLVRSVLSIGEMDGKPILGLPIDEEVYVELVSIIEKEIESLTGVRTATITNRPKPNRLAGECYMNAYNEWKRTGNKPVIGWEATLCGRFISIESHAFNIDKNGKYYDTENNYIDKGEHERPIWVRMAGREAEVWLTEYARYNRTGDINILKRIGTFKDKWGGIGILTHTDNNAYIVRSKEELHEDEDVYSFYKKINNPVNIIVAH